MNALFKRIKKKDGSKRAVAQEDDDSQDDSSKPGKITKKEETSVVSDISHSGSEASAEDLDIPEAIKEGEENDIESLDMVSPQSRRKKVVKKGTPKKTGTKKMYLDIWGISTFFPCDTIFQNHNTLSLQKKCT